MLKRNGGKNMSMKVHGYSKEDLMNLDVAGLRAVLHERTHHGIEVSIYRILQGRMKKPENYGAQAKLVLKVWKERDLPINTPDLEWCIKYVKIADILNEGKIIETGVPEKIASSETARRFYLGNEFTL